MYDEYSSINRKIKNNNIIFEPLEGWKRNLVKLMYTESKKDVSIDVYRPNIVLKSSKPVKMKHKNTRLTKMTKESPHYRGLALWD